MLELLNNLLAPEWFMPHGHCYLWKPDLVLLHVTSDSLITLAYYSIPIMLVYFTYQRRDMPFRWIFVIFGASIVSCGTTHLMEIWTLWHPAYWLSGGIKAVTAFVACYAALELLTLIPQALALPSPAELKAANQQLEREILERKQAEAALCQYKEHLEELVAERTVALTKVNEQLSWQATHDTLTGLLNRHEFEKRIEEALLSVKIQFQEHVLCYFDLDRFKMVNDTCGHLAGDELLYQVSALLKAQCRKTDILARLDGDEFALLLYECSLEQGWRIAQALRESIESLRFVWQDKTFTMGASIGLVAINVDTHSADNLLSMADVACDAAKKRGRNRVHIYQADDRELAQQRSDLQWLERLERAIAENQFRLYYQPIIPLNSCAGGREEETNDCLDAAQFKGEHYEILLRLCDEKYELILPMAFIPAFERYNFMPRIDRWVISTFFTYLRQHRRGDWSHCLYAINLSGASVNDDQFVDFVKEQFSIYQIPPEVICFEITETIAIANLNQAAQLINELRALGCRFSLDDFGSGMSSFGYLKHLPVDYLKIDGHFIKEVADDPMTCAMVEAINRIGHAIGLKTIAEFVTNETILEKVKMLGIDYAQGYGIATPQPLFGHECQLKQGA